MGTLSAGILLYRIKSGVGKVFLVHPGGPFFRNKDKGWWTVPKGELHGEEEPLDAAVREFQEETGYLPRGDFKILKPVVQKGGKVVHCWAVPGDLDPLKMTCNTFPLEWPPKSGKIVNFPEVDKGAWFSFNDARMFINERQRAFVDELEAMLHFQQGNL
jgi:predicted NUDIX family NTP pyrophosphohydrolase